MVKTKEENILLVPLAIITMLIVLLIVFEKGGTPVGKAIYSPIQVYGEIAPTPPDRTKISFKVDGLEIASGEIKNGRYGYEEDLFFKMDDLKTAEKEGYSRGDIVKVYIEDTEIAESSYFETMPRNLEIPASKREEIFNNIAKIALCEPMWECSEWSGCVDNIQARTCIDKNKCRFEKGKPAESKECIIQPGYELPLAEEKKEVLVSWDTIIPVGIVIALILLVTYRAVKKPKRRVLRKRSASKRKK